MSNADWDISFCDVCHETHLTGICRQREAHMSERSEPVLSEADLCILLGNLMSLCHAHDYKRREVERIKASHRRQAETIQRLEAEINELKSICHYDDVQRRDWALELGHPDGLVSLGKLKEIVGQQLATATADRNEIKLRRSETIAMCGQLQTERDTLRRECRWAMEKLQWAERRAVAWLDANKEEGHGVRTDSGDVGGDVCEG